MITDLQIQSLSASAITDYLDCSLQYKFKRIDHLQSEFTADALLLGSTIHQTLQSYYNHQMNHHYWFWMNCWIILSSSGMKMCSKLQTLNTRR